jgi:phosphoglycolate phosphatase
MTMEEPADIRAVLFDFDMTLMDTSYIINECTNMLADAKGLRRVSREETLAVIGLSIEDSWRTLWGKFEPEWLDHYRNEFRLKEEEGFRQFPGTMDTPARLREAGVKTGVVSNRRFARMAVEKSGMSGLFDVIIGLENVANAKPHPEPILTALDEISVPPESAVYVGDTTIDMNAAAAAGVRGLGMTTGNYGAEQLMEAGAEWVCSDLLEIPRVIGISS